MNRVVSDAPAWTSSPLDCRELLEALAAMRELIDAEETQSGSDVELIVTDDAGSETCNGEHLGISGPTNILSFPLSAQTGRAGAGGSLVLSATTLRRESLLYGQEPTEHAVRLLAHGLAHLAGLEHGSEMWALCARLEEAGLSRLAIMRGEGSGHVSDDE